MSNIPTAEQFLSKNIDYVLENDCKQDVETAMIEFARLHVEAALVAKVEAMEKYMNDGYSLDEIDSFTMASYPSTNIK